MLHWSVIEYVHPFIYYWVIVEVLFYAYLKFRIKSTLELKSNDQKIVKSIDVMKLLDIISTIGDSCSVEKFFEGFFKGTPVQNIYVGNVKRFLAWAIYNRHDLNADQEINIHLLIDNIGRRYGIHFQEGFNNQVQHIEMCMESIKACHQPFILCFFYWVIQMACCVLLWIKGFRRCFVNEFSYWHRPSSLRTKKEVTPVVLLHGISPGWMPYMNFIWQFASSTPVFLFELDCIRIGSLDFSRPTPNRVSESIREILYRHGHEQCKLIGHSFGTITCNWFLQRYPQQVKKISLLDPVTLLLFLPDVAINFIYKEPTSFFHYVIRYFAAREITIAHTLFRNFDWKENVLLLDSVDSRTEVFISFSEADEIIPVAALSQYLKQHPNTVIWNLFSHAQMMSSSFSISKLHQESQ